MSLTSIPRFLLGRTVCTLAVGVLLCSSIAAHAQTTDASTTTDSGSQTTTGATLTLSGSTNATYSGSLTISSGSSFTVVPPLIFDSTLNLTNVNTVSGVSMIGSTNSLVTQAPTTAGTLTLNNGTIVTDPTALNFVNNLSSGLTFSSGSSINYGALIDYGSLISFDPSTFLSSAISSGYITTVGGPFSTSQAQTGSTLSAGSTAVISSGTSLLSNANGGAAALTLVGGSSLTTANAINAASTITVGNTSALVKTGSGTLNLSTAAAASYQGSLVVNGTTVGSISSGTISLTNGGVLDLTSILSSGLSLAIGSSSNSSGSLPVGTTGLIAITNGSTTASTSGTVTVSALGSLPAGNTPNSTSFATPAVALIGIGDVGSQGISERGVIYSLTSSNGTPTLGGSGVVKVVHTGNPTSSGSFSLTATGLAANTQYSYRVYATDSTGATYLSQPSTFTTPTVLQNWRQTFFGSTNGTSNAADSADPDGDGVPNLVEFATGKNPTNPNASAATVSHSGSDLEYTYTRSLDALNAGTTFIVEWNDTLNPSLWSSAGVSEAVVSDDGIVQQVKAAVPAGSTGRRFMRLKVVPPAQ